MRGTVLGVDSASGLAQIAGDDGRRYAFARDDWQQPGTPQIGQAVDFTTAGERAVSVFGLGVPSAAVPAGRGLGGRNRIVAALLAFFVGYWGIHKFYLGKNGAGLTMLLAGTIGWLLVVPALACWAVALIESLKYFVTDDAVFQRRYVEGDKAWF